MEKLPKDITPEELEKLSLLLQMMRQGEKNTSKSPQKKKKVKGNKRRPRSQKKQTAQKPEPIEEKVPRARRAKRKIKRRKVKSHEIQARSEPIQIGARPNKFEVVDGKVVLAGKKLPETAEERKAKQFDKVISLKHEPTERRDESMIEAQCRDCGKISDVSEKLLIQDPDTREYSYICNSCSMKR